MPFNRIPEELVIGGLPVRPRNRPESGVSQQCIWGCEHAGLCSPCRVAGANQRWRSGPGACIHGLCQRRCMHEVGHGEPLGVTAFDVHDSKVVHHCDKHIPPDCPLCFPPKDCVDNEDDPDLPKAKKCRPNRKERRRNHEAGLSGNGEPMFQ